MKKQIIFIALLFFAFDVAGQTPVTTRRLNTDSIVEKVLNNGIEVIGATNFHDTVTLQTVPDGSSPEFVISYDSASGLVTKTPASSFASDTQFSDIGNFLKVGADGRPAVITNMDHSGNQSTQYSFNDSVLNSAIPRFRFAYIWNDQAIYGNTPVNSVLGRLAFTGGLDGNGLGLGAQIEAFAAENFTSTSSPAYLQFSTSPSGSVNNTNLMFFSHKRSLQLGYTSLDMDTFSLSVGSGGNGIALFNIPNTPTAMERGSIRWTGNEFVIATQEAGSGTGRNLHMQTPRAGIILAGTTTTPVIDFDLAASGTPTIFMRIGNNSVLTSTTVNQSLVNLGAGFSASSGSVNKMSIDINNTVNLTGTFSGIAYGIRIRPTITSAPDYRALAIESGKLFLPVGGLPWVPASSSTNDSILVKDASTGQVKAIAQPLSGSATLDFPNTASNDQSDLTIAVTGAVDGDIVALGVPNAATVQGSYFAWVSATDTITVRFHNTAGGAIDPASGTFKVKVLR